jgi:hypothetical protein
MEDAIFFISIYFVRPLTVLIHELGHAVPALILTRQKVTVFVGTYGSTKGCIQLPLGLIIIYFHYIPFGWNKGVCIPESKNISVDKQIIYTLCGPIASLLVAAGVLLLRPTQDGYSYMGFFLILFLCSAVFDLFHNLIPNPKPITLDNGSQTYNDGKSLSRLFQIRNIRDAYPFYEAKNFKEAYVRLSKAIESGIDHPMVFTLALSSLAHIGPTKNDILFLHKIKARNQFQDTDELNLGVCYAMLEENEEAEKIFNQILLRDANNLFAHANIGYLRLTDKKYSAALEKFDLVTTLNPKFAYGFACRGMSKIYLGNYESGLQDVQSALTLDPHDPSSHSALGLHAMKIKEYSKALEHFEKAKNLNPNIHKIDQLIERARNGQDIDDL